MKRNYLLYLFCLLLIGISSCTSYKKVPYLQTKEKSKEIELSSFYRENTVRFQPDDVLSITINVVGEQSVAYDFNLPLQPSGTTDNSSESFVDQGVGRQTYMVNKDGKIDFPVLGMVRVSGYTQAELEQFIKDSLRKYLKVDPVVTVRLMNFRISVLGEVNRPGQYSINKDHINILEVLSLAGDMTIYGKRDDVWLIREMPDGEVKMLSVDVSNMQVVSSPHFYLQQNDMLYVVPNRMRAQAADISPQLGTVISVASFLISVGSFVLLLIRK
ncbi:MAG: polysaccharide biosynthesis/export family protein [Dysgonamonadaceae bacterium]|jgi:polysaccharide export outer membrane protein|nr:polysaccharide biosynthesis/export family protein [Dysgonamonadaceae bacterium]